MLIELLGYVRAIFKALVLQIVRVKMIKKNMMTMTWLILNKIPTFLNLMSASVWTTNL